MLTELANLDATAQAELIRKREIKPTELLESAIERAEKINPQINAIVTPMDDIARAAAKSGLPDGPLSGVPYLLKDHTAAFAGVRMTFGSKFCRDLVAPHDSELVIRLKRAGLNVFGKTNTPEFGILPTTEPELFGATKNPWNLGRTTGGSSGGSAAAVAARIVPAAHANDGGGSIRIPASCCGIFGLKPTRARNPLGPDIGDVMSGLVAEHAVTISVRDSAALLDATAGPDIGDPYYAPPKERPYAQEVGANPGKLRIAFAVKADTGAPIHADCVAAVKDTAKLLESLGHHVEEASPTLEGPRFTQSFMCLWTTGMAAFIDALALMMKRQPKPEDFEPGTWALYQSGRAQTGSNYLLAVMYLQSAAREIARFFTQYDVWLTPTLAEPPVPLGSFDAQPGNPMAGLARAAAFVPFTPILNVTGQPAMSVPLYWNAENLPIGSHFVGRFGDEATLFRLAAQLEQARPWADKLPPVCA